jgi:crotonobetainyl-CoA:carnitine CoA-transferase CaiB-like acyl-CoA transferase
VAHVLITVFAALAHRDRTGQGSHTDAGLAAAAVQEIADLFADAGLWAHDGLAQLRIPNTDITTWVTGPFQRMQSPRAHVRWPSPHPGQHNDEVLRDWLTPQGSPVPNAAPERGP